MNSHRSLLSQLICTSLALLALAMFVSTCTATSTSQPTVQATVTQLQLTETPLPPTATPRPTKIPLPTTTSTPELGSQAPATTVEQVVGQWTLYLAGGGEGDPAVITFTSEGTFSMDAIGGYHKGMNVGFGTFRFEGNNLVLDSDNCAGATDIFPCTASYRVYYYTSGDKNTALKLNAVDDPHIDRKESLNKKILFAYEG